MTASSSVGTTHADTFDAAGEMRGPLAVFAGSSSCNPSHSYRRTISALTGGRVFADTAGEDDAVDAAHQPANYRPRR